MKRFLALGFLLFCAPVQAQTTVTIHITNDQNQPVAGAQVEVNRKLREKNVAAVSDANGDATITPTVDPEYPGSTVYALVWAPGYAVQAAALKPGAQVTLEKGIVVPGQVVDAVGKGVEGVEVQPYMAFKPGYEDAARLDKSQMGKQFVVKTDKDGAFVLHDLPEKRSIQVGIDDPRFVRVKKVWTEGELTLTARPGGALHGRLIGVDGQPLPNIHVFAATSYFVSLLSKENSGDEVTASDGSYTIISLAPGQHYVGAELPKDAPFLVQIVDKVVAIEGQTQEVPDMKAISGTVVKGLVRDAETGQPLAGAYVGGGAKGADSSATVTDKEGAFRFRLPPGPATFYVGGAPTGYRRVDIHKTVEVTDTPPAPVVFDLQKATVITGTLVDQNNRPIAAQIVTSDSGVINSGPDGKWKMPLATDSTIRIGGGEAEDGYFQILSERQIVIPVTAPIVIQVVKKPWQPLNGRVVSIDGSPIPGARLNTESNNEIGPSGGESHPITTTTDAQGRFVFARLRPWKTKQLTDVEVSKTGYAVISGGKISRDDTGPSITDFVMTPLNVNLEGTTVPGAAVLAATQETVADAAGRFTFKGLPAGDLTVYAAKDGQFGQVAVVPGQPLHIELKKQELQGIDVDLGRQIWSDTLQDPQNAKYFALDWLRWRMGHRKVDDVAGLRAEAHEPYTPDHDEQLATLAGEWAPKLQKTGQLDVLNEVFAGIQTREFRLRAMLSAATTSGDAVLLRRALDESEAVLPLTPPDSDWRETNLYLLAVVSEKVEGQKAGFDALDAAVRWTLAHHPAKDYKAPNGGVSEPGADQYLSWSLKTIATGSPELLKRLLGNIDPEMGYGTSGFAQAIRVVAQRQGIDAALPLMEDLLKLPIPTSPDHRPNNDPQGGFNNAATALIPLVGEKSPAAALALARRVTPGFFELRALAAAARFQSGATATSLWREIVKRSEVQDAPRYAAQAWEFDPKLGAELFSLVEARVRAETEKPFGLQGFWPDYAFYYARVDPAVARLILEREWALSIQTKGEGHSQHKIALAMSAIDAKRADEMARQAGSAFSRSKIGGYLQANAQARHELPFGRWSVGDTWEPGTPEW